MLQRPVGGERIWALVARQHGVVARRQLLELGFRPQAIGHRIRTHRLHPVARGVYAVGRPDISEQGKWMAAVLSCGPHAVLSHLSAAVLWEIYPRSGALTDVSIPARGLRRRPGIAVHRRTALGLDEITVRYGLPVTTVVCTLVDIAARLDRAELERAINEADRHDLTNPEELRAALDRMVRRPGIAVIRALLDRQLFVLTDSELESLFLPIARSAGLSTPRTRCTLNGYRVDFYWPDLGLVVETDGLRYHRTPAQQARDRVRDQAHFATGLTPLRFIHAQIRYEPHYVRDTLITVARRLRRLR